MDNDTVDHLVVDINKVITETKEVVLKTITVTDEAASKFREFMKEEGKTNFGIRFGAHGGGCSGYQYTLDFADNANETEDVLEDNGIKLFVDRSILEKIKGTKIDYVENEKGSGFKIEQVSKTAGCGTGCGCSE